MPPPTQTIGVSIAVILPPPREASGAMPPSHPASAPAAMPGLTVPAAAGFVEAVGGRVNPKFGWTDVARFTSLGIPAVNFGPGDPMLAHKQEEHVPVEHIERCERQLTEWLT